MTTKLEYFFLDEDRLEVTSYGTYLSGLVEDLGAAEVLEGVTVLQGICSLAMTEIKLSPFDTTEYGVNAAGVYDDAEDHLVFEGRGPAGEKHKCGFPCPDESIFGLTPDGINADPLLVAGAVSALEDIWCTSAGGAITVESVYRERSPRYKYDGSIS